MALNLQNKYPGRFDPVSADYPQGKFKNRSSPTAQDGSYMERDWLNDWAGFFGALLSGAGVTPNGNVDTARASQLYDALESVVPTMVPTASTTHAGTVEMATTQEAISGAPGVVPDAAGVLASIQNNVTPGIGIGQSWQNVTSSRSVGVTYTNTTGRTIVVKVSAEAVSNYIYIQCTGSVESIQSAGRDAGVSVSSYAEIDIIVPPSGTYSVILGGLGGPFIRNWWELR